LKKRKTPTRAIAGGAAAIVDSADDAIVGQTPDGVITSWNAAAERMFGYPSAEALGRHISLVIPEDRRAEEDAVRAHVQRGQRVEHFDTIRVTRDGRHIDVSVTVSPIRGRAGAIVGASEIARDVSDRKQVERQRVVLLEEAEAAARAKDDFLAMFGHQLRNSLGAIAGAASLLNDSGPAEKPLAVIDRQIGELRRRVDDLLEAARIRTSNIRLARRPVNLAEAVARVLAGVRAGMTPVRHVLQVEAEDVGVIADPNRVDQIILNLVTNALKYTPSGKTIRIVTRGDGDQAVLTVADEGVGIASEALPRIFDLFDHGERSVDRALGGLGIGLAMVRMLVELHGGTVEAASEGADRGSAFTVRLPRAALPRPVEATPPPPAPAARRRVLIVDDNDDAREMLRLYLEVQGHEVFAAVDGAEAIQMAAEVLPEVALIDVGLPIVDGYEVARQIRLQPTQPMRLVAVTGFGQPEDRQRCLAAGFDEHLVKPVDSARLNEILQWPADQPPARGSAVTR
jgi:PAS domain S-box-containing protein